MSSLFDPLRQRIRAWRRRPLEQGPVTLRRQRIYVLPTRSGLSFAVALVVMLIASINYNLSLGYGVVFLLGSIAFVSMIHCFRNLYLLRIQPGRVEPVFAGDTAQFHVRVDQPTPRRRPGLQIRAAGEAERFSITDLATHEVSFRVPSTRRGWLRAGTIHIATTYPLGLFRAWSVVHFDLRCLVYPKPEADPPPLPLTADGAGNAGLQAGDDDFAGLRAHDPAHSPRHIAWKVVARGGPLLTKQFVGMAAETACVDWYATPEELDVERRLSRMAAWALAADARQLQYILRLPGEKLPLGGGVQQLQQSLRALALHGLPEHAAQQP
jgi:uncharacterized protein (DUF58 family)